MILRPSCATLFPYTTLFRSREHARFNLWAVVQPRVREDVQDAAGSARLRVRGAVDNPRDPGEDDRPGAHRARLEGDVEGRSEEHTSELQSHVNLVCRLLLEK